MAVRGALAGTADRLGNQWTSFWRWATGLVQNPLMDGPDPGPPSKHQLALMIWLAVFPTLTVHNLALGDWLATLTPVVRTFVLATTAVPIVIYGFMPQLHRLRGRLLTRVANS